MCKLKMCVKSIKPIRPSDLPEHLLGSPQTTPPSIPPQTSTLALLEVDSPPARVAVTSYPPLAHLPPPWQAPPIVPPSLASTTSSTRIPSFMTSQSSNLWLTTSFPPSAILFLVMLTPQSRLGEDRDFRISGEGRDNYWALRQN